MRNHIIRLTALLALLVGAPSALASGSDVINDCTDDEVLSKTYSQKDYRDALAQLPADADQYGNCRDVIARAQESAATKGGSKGGDGRGEVAGGQVAGGANGAGGASTPSSSSLPAKDQLAAAPAPDRAAAQQAARSKSSAAVGPGNPIATAAEVGRAPDSSGVSDLPAPILALLALLLVGALALAASQVRSLVHARRA